MSVAPALASDLLRDLAAGRPRKVVVYGTSLTASGPWVGQMQTWLTGMYPGTLTLINSGLSGKTSDEAVAQLQAKVLAHVPDTVFIEFAMNDAFLFSNETPQVSVAKSRQNVETMIDGILGVNPRAEIILQTTNSVWDSPAGSNASATLRPNLPAYYQMYRDVAAERGLLLIDHYPNWAELQTSNTATFQSYIPDGVHPNAAGTKAIVMPLLQEKLIGEIQFHTTTAEPTLLQAEVCVYGGTSGAITAALQAARAGRKVVLLTPDRRFGGLTTNGLGWTDIGSPSAIGGMAREFYRRIYYHYLDDSAWTRETRSAYISRSGIDPDTSRRMMFTFEPKIALKHFEDMLAESDVLVVRGRLDRGEGGVKVEDRRIREIRTEDGKTSIRAGMFIDATYEGDLLAAAGVSYAVGREPNAQYGETLNGIQTARSGGNQLPNGINPYITPGSPQSGLLPGVNANAGGSDGEGDERLQAYTFRMAMTDVPANRMPVPKPEGYQESDFEVLFRAIAAGQTSNFFKTSEMPNRKTDSNNSTGASTDFIGGNYSLEEGWNYAEASYEKRQEIIEAHVRYQKGFVWALQNSPRVPENIRTAWSKWGLPLDEFTENGSWPDQLYVREARRLVGDLVIAQKHVDQETGFIATDSVGMGGYNMDSHHVQRHAASGQVKNEGDVQVAPKRGPYGISYRALVPKAAEIENLLVPVAVSSSHIAYGSIRMEPVFMILGQSAGAAASIALEDGVSVQ
ncbi:MAG: FAD-dependent oxidoreductase, partial [Chthoniobacteraceae bacterium]